MIGALARAEARDWELLKASRQKKDALFELACRIALLAEGSRQSGASSLAEAAEEERRKALRAGLAVVAAGGDAEELGRALAEEADESDPGALLESRLVRSGLLGLLAGEHPYTLMRRMSAHLGAEYYDKAGAWILGRVKRRRAKPEPLVVPGELPDVVRDLSFDARFLERALRAAGHEIAAAALAGCPQESMDLAKPLYGKIGGAVIEDDAAFLRPRLSGDEIAQAQSAFLEIARGLEERGDLEAEGAGEASSEDGLDVDPAFIAELTKAVVALDADLLRAAFRGADPASLAAAMQGMEPRAHERILAALPKKDAKRVLDAIDEAPPLRARAVLEASSQLAALILAAAGKQGVAAKSSTSRSALQKLERIEAWPAAKR
jgi:hypothetical protein